MHYQIQDMIRPISRIFFTYQLAQSENLADFLLAKIFCQKLAATKFLSVITSQKIQQPRNEFNYHKPVQSLC